MLVFKGGNALDFIWQPNRSTRDLDFSVDMSIVASPLDVDSLRNLPTPPLQVATRVFGIGLRVHGIDQQPSRPNRTFITSESRIGFALPDEVPLRARMEQGRPSSHIIPVEISLNEPICSDTRIGLDETHFLRVSTLEDIVAEKLRALLQQSIRNRTRRQDLLDIAVILRGHAELNRAQVGQFLIRKAQARNVPVSRAAFRHPTLAERARLGYDELCQTTRTSFVAFEDALRALCDLTDRLDIPD